MTNTADTTTEVARLSRVSVVCGSAQVDVSLPLHSPTEVLIPELVQLFGDRISGTAESAWARPWQLAPVGRDPLPGPHSPADAGITEGDLLILFVATAPPPPPVFDDVFDTAAAELDAGRRWDERTATLTGLVIAVAATLATAAVAVRLGLDSTGDSATRPVVDSTFAQLWSAAAAIVLLVLGGAAARRMREPGAVPATLTGCAAALAAVAGLLTVPFGSGGYEAAHYLLAVVAAATVSVIALRVTGVAIVLHTAIIVATSIAGLALLAIVWLPDRVVAIAATAAVVGYVVIWFAARIGAAVARIPLPSVPAAGERIDPIDDDPPPTVAGVGAVASALMSTPVAQPPALHAQRITEGITVGAAVSGGGAALIVGTAQAPLPLHQLAFVLVVAVVYCLRGRTHGDPVQAAATIVAGAIVAVGTAVSLAWGAGIWPLLGMIALAAVAGLALACGIIAPRSTFSPVQRRLAELGEYLTIAAVGPLLGWVWDVYATVRNL